MAARKQDEVVPIRPPEGLERLPGNLDRTRQIYDPERGVCWVIQSHGPRGVDIELLGPEDEDAWRRRSTDPKANYYSVCHVQIRLTLSGTMRKFSERLAPKGTCPYTALPLSPKGQRDPSIAKLVHRVNSVWTEGFKARGLLTPQGANTLALELEAIASYIRTHGTPPAPGGGQLSMWGPRDEQPLPWGFPRDPVETDTTPE